MHIRSSGSAFVMQLPGLAKQAAPTSRLPPVHKRLGDVRAWRDPLGLVVEHRSTPTFFPTRSGTILTESTSGFIVMKRVRISIIFRNAELELNYDRGTDLSPSFHISNSRR
jgi:hypothetical protein